MVKEADASNLTAAIGDGGNDVSMIQEAQLGMGIIGVEGDAAAKAADFAFAKVR
jgi:P-type E1-E2 ATPase